jgi:hypothetical protein
MSDMIGRVRRSSIFILQGLSNFDLWYENETMAITDISICAFSKQDTANTDFILC